VNVFDWMSRALLGTEVVQPAGVPRRDHGVTSCKAVLLRLFLGLVLFTTGCTDEASAPVRMTLREAEQGSDEVKLIAAINDLSVILEDKAADPAKVLQDLRTYFQTHEATIRTSVENIDQNALSLSPSERAVYVEQHESQIREAMQRFANAQHAFQKSASQAQKVELNELMNGLQ